MRNGLYSIHVHLLDGRNGKGSGVVLFRNGIILGGDAYLYYTGTYAVTGSRFAGEVQIMQHTPSPNQSPLFGNQTQPVGVGVSGAWTDTTATMDGTALVGKASQIFHATLRYLAEAE